MQVVRLFVVLFLLGVDGAMARPAQNPPAVQSEIKPSVPETVAESPFVVRVEQAAPFQMASSPKSWWEQPYVQPAISAGAALLGAILGGLLARQNMSAANTQRANEIEIGQLQTKLNDFYGRFRLISEENKLIALEFKKRQGGGDFRTLLALLDPGWCKNLPPADKTIVLEMVQNGVALRNLIRDKAGLVDQKIVPYLTKVSAHFAMLDLAHKGLLENDRERFQQYVYPEQLDPVLDIEIKRLLARIDLLLRHSETRHGPMPPLIIPCSLQL